MNSEEFQFVLQDSECKIMYQKSALIFRQIYFHILHIFINLWYGKPEKVTMFNQLTPFVHGVRLNPNYWS